MTASYLLRAIGAGACVLALAGCGSDGGGDGSSGTGGAGIGGTGAGGSGGGADGAPGSEIDACAIVTRADATALFGEKATPDTSNNPVVDANLLGECLWAWDTETSGQLLQFRVWNGAEYHDVPDTAEAFAVGTDGYVNVDPFWGIDVEWVQDARTIELSYSNVGPDAPDTATKVEPMKALAFEVSSRL